MDTQELVNLENVSVRYGAASGPVVALSEVSLSLARGEFVAITGPSGSGKSTLLNIVSGLERPVSGKVFLEGVDIRGLSDRQMSRIRRKTVSYIFQFFNLLPTLTAIQNVEIPLRADRESAEEVRHRAARALEMVGLASRAQHLATQLSGGEMQRVAIARALASEARLLLADEPTGNLDSVRGEEILELLKCTVEREGRSVLLVTHDLRAAAFGDRIITLRDGRIVDEVCASPKAGVTSMGR